MLADHSDLVSRVARQVAGYYRRQAPFRVFHGSTNSTRVMAFDHSETVDVSDLNRVLSIDAKRKTATVEANVPMDALVAATLRHGLLPPVITEFPGITVGGGIQGGAGESSSGKWGFLSQTVNWAEYVLADGSVVRASPTQHADLFYGAAGSSGTLGIITAAELQLVPAQKYVELTYQPVTSFVGMVDATRHAVAADYDFVDGVMFGPDHGLVITGKLTMQKQHRLQRFSRAHDPWFYLHAAKIDAAGMVVQETVPLVDYLFRYDRGAFWMGAYTFERFGVPFNALTRFVLNPLLHTRKLYQALQGSGASQEYIVQDLTLPLDKAVPCLEFIDKTVGIYPLWVCPVKPEPRSPFMCNGLQTPLAINIGLWGRRMTDHNQFVRLNRQIETKLASLGGKKWTYAHFYYPEAEFWKVYDKDWYDGLRRKYHAEFLPSIYDKLRVRGSMRVSDRKGVLAALTGKAWLR
jgi:delta24-sterol reductase